MAQSVACQIDNLTSIQDHKFEPPTQPQLQVRSYWSWNFYGHILSLESSNLAGIMYSTIQEVNSKGADQIAQMRRLISTFVVRISQKQVFSWRGSFVIWLQSRITSLSLQPSYKSLEEIGHEISMTIFSLVTAVSIKKGSCQLLAEEYMHVVLR